MNEWSEDGTLERIWRTLLSKLDAEQKLVWTQAFLDGSFVLAKKGAKTKVGKGSKVMAVVDSKGLPLGLHVDSAQPQEVTLAEMTLQDIHVP